jgi:hypothetical protein
MAERLADKYEEAKEKQEDIMNRSVGHVTFQFPTQVGPPISPLKHMSGDT